MGNGLDHATERITIFAGSINAPNDSLGNLKVGHTGNIRLDLLASNRDGIDIGNKGVNLPNISDNIDIAIAFEQFARNRTCSNAANCLARTGSASPLPVANTVFLFIRIIGVRRAVFGAYFFVIFGTRILVPNHHRDGCTKGLTLKKTRVDFYLVFFFALRGDFTLARFAAVEFNLNIFFADLQTGRAPIQNNANAATMRLSPCGNAKRAAKCAAHNRLLWIVT